MGLIHTRVQENVQYIAAIFTYKPFLIVIASLKKCVVNRQIGILILNTTLLFNLHKVT